MGSCFQVAEASSSSMVVHLTVRNCEYTDAHLTVHCKIVSFVSCELYSNKKIPPKVDRHLNRKMWRSG